MLEREKKGKGNFRRAGGGLGSVRFRGRRLFTSRGGGKKSFEPGGLQRLDRQKMDAAIHPASPPHGGEVYQNRQVLRRDLEAQREVRVDGEGPVGLDAAAFQGKVQESPFAGGRRLRGERHAVMNGHGHVMLRILRCAKWRYPGAPWDSR